MASQIRAIDTAVHPNPRSVNEIREYLPRSYRGRPFPASLRYLYPAPTGVAPFGAYAAEAYDEGGQPGSDIEQARVRLAALGADAAVLLPATRGVLPNLDLGSAVCAATNDWLAATWLAPSNGMPFYGSIRLNPLDVDNAVKELERWAGDSRMVQVGVPLESQLPYGHRAYFKLWEAVAESGLPVAVHQDGYSGASFHPTPSGFPRHYAEFTALYPNNFIYHLTSLIAEGVFERLPMLRFVFTNGGFDVLTPLMWRMDMDWPITRIEAPWVTKRPMLYLADHVRFVASGLEGPPDQAMLHDWAALTEASTMLLYGSGYPLWSTTPASDVFPDLDEDARRGIMRDNALDFYRLRSYQGTSVDHDSSSVPKPIRP